MLAPLALVCMVVTAARPSDPSPPAGALWLRCARASSLFSVYVFSPPPLSFKLLPTNNDMVSMVCFVQVQRCVGIVQGCVCPQCTANHLRQQDCSRTSSMGMRIIRMLFLTSMDVFTTPRRRRPAHARTHTMYTQCIPAYCQPR